MKKLLFTTALLIVSSTLLFSQTRFGVKAGVNFANQEWKSEGVSLTMSSLTSFHLMGLADIPLSSAFSIQPGIGISGKGTKLDVEDFSAEFNLLYLDIPVNAIAKFPISSVGKFFIGAGPYAGIGISGKAKGDGIDEDESDDLFADEGAYKRMDFGLNFLTGVELNSGFIINANYGLGLSNIAQEAEGDSSVKNKVFSLSLGFLF